MSKCWSWATINTPDFGAHNPVYVAGIVFSVFIAGSVAYRSGRIADKIAFGAAAVAFFLVGLTTAPLGATATLTIKAAKSLMWTLAAAVALGVLLRGSNSQTK